MYPVLAEIGPVTIYSYGFFIALAFLLGLGIWKDEARQKSLQVSLMPGLAFMLILSFLLGARLAFFFQHEPALLLERPANFLYFWQGGLSFWGGAGLAALTWVVFLGLNKQPLFAWADSMAPSLAAGYAVGGIACFLSGSCHGSPTNFILAVRYDHFQSQAPLFIPLHPTQMYYSLSGILVFILLTLIKPRLHYPGQLMAIFLLAYSFLYFNISLLRGDVQFQPGGLLWQQWLAILIFLAGLICYFKTRSS